MISQNSSQKLISTTAAAAIAILNHKSVTFFHLRNNYYLFQTFLRPHSIYQYRQSIRVTYDKKYLSSKMATMPRPVQKLEDIDTWTEYFAKLNAEQDGERPKFQGSDSYEPNPKINSKLSLHQGDITRLAVDAIVNAANESLLGGGGVDGSIHKAAGEGLFEECRELDGCDPGDAKVTRGYNLPANYVIHTVGPRGEKPEVLTSCYKRCFQILLAKHLRSIAFPCISTGIFGYPRCNAAHIALSQARKFLEEHSDDVDRVIICVFLDEDREVYEVLMPYYFPVTAPSEPEAPVTAPIRPILSCFPEEAGPGVSNADKPQN